jgi:hypothetical protein
MVRERPLVAVERKMAMRRKMLSRRAGTQKSSADFGAAVTSDLGIACFAGAKPDMDSIEADLRR